tara:strand:- start:17026 stop:19311 length:2286 start_codon:yes stop_codon:yes gene_type:complete
VFAGAWGLSLLGAGTAVNAEEASPPAGPLEILSSGQMDYDFESNTITVTGPAKADYGPYRLEAGRIVWDRKNGLVRVSDGMILDNSGLEVDLTPRERKGDFFEAWWPDSYTEVPFILTAGKADLSFENRSIDAEDGVVLQFSYGRFLTDRLEVEGGDDKSVYTENVRSGSGGFLLEADEVRGSEEKSVFKGVGVYLNDPSDWGPRVNSKKMEHKAGAEYVTLYGVTLGIGPVPVLYLPKAWARDWDLGISFDLGAGFSDTLGTYGEFGVSFKALPAVRLSPSIAYFGLRGLLVSPDFSWSGSSATGEYYTEGSVLSGFISDQGSDSLRGVDRFGDPIGTDRGYVLAKGLVNQREGWSFVNQLEERSDTEVLRDFRPELESRYFAPESFSELFVPMGPVSFTALGRYRTLDMTESIDAVPSVSLALEPAHLGVTPIKHQGWVDFSRLDRANQDDDVEASANRWEAAYRLSYTLPTVSWLSITPVTGVRERYYQDVQDSGTDGSSTLFEVGVDIGADFHREWPVKSEIWNIDRLVHQTRPMMGYRWMPQSGMPEDDIPSIYPDVYTSGVNPLGFSDLVYRSDTGAEQVLRIGWENRILAGSYGEPKRLRALGSFSIYQDFMESREGEDSLPSSTLLDITAVPAPWLGLELFSRVDSESMTLIELVPGVSLRDGDRWESTWYFQSLQHEVNQLLWDAEVAVNRNNWILFEMRYNGQSQEITKQVYGWRHRLGNAWLIDAKMIFRRGDTREGDFQINFGVTSLLF